MIRRYQLFGGFNIEDDDRPSVLLKYRKGCALLAYLIVTGQTCRREMMADLLWEASSTAQSLRNLRKLLHQLRPLAPELVLSRDRLAFQAPDDAAVDFLTLAGALAGQDLTLLEQALALYKGDLLAGFDLGDIPQFEEWLLPERERCRQRAWDGYHRLCTALVDARRWQAGVAWARRWVGLDPLSEQAHQWLLRFLVANGQRAAALAQHESYRQTLWQELGTDPGAASLKLLAQIEQLADGEPDLSALFQHVPRQAGLTLYGSGPLAPAGALPPLSHLPFHRNAIFTGRQGELRRLAEVLLPRPAAGGPLPQAAVVTGMGGLGKTQLAVEFAYRYGRNFPGGVYWFNFAEGAHLHEQVGFTGGSGGLKLFSEKDQLDPRQKASLVRRAWQEPLPRLLIFDNCDDENLAVAWLPVSGGCSVLITSRLASWSKALPLTVLSLDTLPRPESITLLQTLAETLVEPAADLVAEAVGDWPLALHLAGSYLDQYADTTAQEYVGQLRRQPLFEHASLQGQHIRFSPTGHELNMAGTFAVTFERLERPDPVAEAARQQLAFTACLAANEPVPLDMLEQMAASAPGDEPAAESAEKGMARLLALGLLRAGDEQTVVMHHLLALFTRLRLAGANRLAAAQRIVENALIHQLEAYKAVNGSLTALPFAITHLRFVAGEAAQREDENALHLATLLASHLIEVADYEEAQTYLTQARDFIERHHGGAGLEAAEWATSQGNLLLETGQYEASEACFHQALAIRRRELGENHLDTALSLNNMGAIYSRIGAYPAAASYFEQALVIRQRLLGPEHPRTLSVLNNLGAVHNFMGDRATARRYFEKVLAVREKTLGKDHLLTATALNNLGDLLNRMGDSAAGRPYLERAVRIREDQLGPDHPLTWASKTNLGELLSRLGEFKQARQCLEQALSAALPKIGENHYLTARILNTQGVMFARMGHFAAAKEKLEWALVIREQVRGEDHPDTAYTLICLGEMYLVQAQPARARPLLRRAVMILEDKVEPTDANLQLARTYLAQVDKGAAAAA